MRRRILAGVVVAAAGLAAPSAAADHRSRYSLAGGCYGLRTADGWVAGAERVRMQATALGSYLLYRPDGTFVTAAGPAREPGPEADLRVAEAGGGTFDLQPASGRRGLRRVTFSHADGCAAFPEAELNARGRPARGAAEYVGVRGLLEGHMHWMTYEKYGRQFQCGRPWHRYGIARALPDCDSVEGPRGVAAPVQNFFNYGNPVQPHDTRGWPYLPAWGAGNLTYEGTYWRWVQRAWMAGLRLMVMGVNDNRILCELQARRETACNEMDTVRRGLRAVRELQDYVDAQAGGPGKGFFAIVRDPLEARRVINSGRMAVVLEIEVSEPFDCRGWARPSCDRAQVDRELDELHRLGVRSALLLNKFDNPLTGVRFDSGLIGLLTNPGNRLSAGSFFSARTCTGPLTDNTIETFVPPASAALDATLAAVGVQRGTAPAYPPAPHCNTRGLTGLGRHVVRRMANLGMIVNPDHMSQAAVEDTLALLEARRHSGVISPHGWIDPGNWPRIWRLGGLAFPGHSRATEYVRDWRRYRPAETPFAFGWGYGADLGGLSQQPETGQGAGGIDYPFRGLDGAVSFDRQRTGERTFDYRTEGVAHYGLYADWFEDLRRVGGTAMAADMLAGAEAYLQMWERATGVRAVGCRTPYRALGRRTLGPLRLGDRWETVLRRAGQPQQRTRAWTWCVRGRGNSRAADVAVFDAAGRVQLVGSTARNRSLSGVPVGGRAISDGVHAERDRRGARIWVVSRGRVRAAAVATRALARRPAALRAAVRRLLAARASAAPRRYVPGGEELERPVGRALAATGRPGVDTRLVLLCRLQL